MRNSRKLSTYSVSEALKRCYIHVHIMAMAVMMIIIIIIIIYNKLKQQQKPIIY